MIELTEAQIQSLDAPLTSADYDDSPWTREELEATAWEVVARRGEGDISEYDNLSEKL